jgi:RNA polymerase sigma factor (sigma-70 family)
MLVSNLSILRRGRQMTEATVETEVTDAEIIKLCKSLARRYKSTSQYEDLISEGLVACYELKVTGNNDKGAYVGAARRAMNDYANIRSKAVSIPVAGASRIVSHAIATDSDMEGLDGVTGGTFFNLMAAMSNSTEMVTENSGFTPDHATKYEEDEYDAYVLSVAITTLNQTEWTIIKMRYYEGMTQDMVADRLNTNQKWVSRHEITALDKLKATLCNNS